MSIRIDLNDPTALPPEPPSNGPRLKLLGRELFLPRSRLLRTVIGGLLVAFGIFGFLPVLGYWMIPVGLLILANDFPTVRRFNRRSGVWIRRRFGRKR